MKQFSQPFYVVSKYIKQIYSTLKEEKLMKDFNKLEYNIIRSLTISHHSLVRINLLKFFEFNLIKLKKFARIDCMNNLTLTTRKYCHVSVR